MLHFIEDSKEVGCVNLPFRDKGRRCCNGLEKGNHLTAIMLFNVWILLSPTADHLCLCSLAMEKSFLTDIRNCIWLDVGVNQGCKFSKMIFDVGMYSLATDSSSVSCCKFRMPRSCVTQFRSM